MITVIKHTTIRIGKYLKFAIERNYPIEQTPLFLKKIILTAWIYLAAMTF